MSLHQRQHQQQNQKKPSAWHTLLNLLALTFLFAFTFLPWSSLQRSIGSILTASTLEVGDWKDYTLAEAVAFVARNDTVIVCTVGQGYLPFMNNWLISITRQKRQDQVLVLAEDYESLYEVNRRWPGHAVLVQPALPPQAAHDFGSEGFFNFTSRRPRHLLQIIELGYSVLYNDVDMVWLADPFPYFEGSHDAYFNDDTTFVKPLNHSHSLPTPSEGGQIYVCSCFIFLNPTPGAKILTRQWIEEVRQESWSPEKRSNDQPAFNSALAKTAGQVGVYLLSQAAFPPGRLYFDDQNWYEETKGMHVIAHNNYIIGYEVKKRRFKDHNQWLVDDHSDESPLGKIEEGHK